MRGPEPENLAYLVYTSGSGGRPKGVAVRHAGVAALARWAREVFGRKRPEVVLAGTSLGFDLSVFELFVPLVRGGRVVLARDVLELAELPEAHEVTLVNTVPSAMAELLRAGPLPGSVATVNLAGEALPRSLVDQLFEQPSVERVWNLYGPSEDTTYSTSAALRCGDTRAPAIGRPIPGTRALVLDAGLWPLPAGVPGELCLGGSGLARGYLDLPGRTAERFVPDPLTASPGARLYRTGDRVRHRRDGELEYLGRLDAQIKVRGVRIEPGEIETILAEHPAVIECAVAALGTLGGRRRLAAWVVLAEDEGVVDSARQAEQVRHWRTVYDGLYGRPSAANPELDTAGWVSSYTDEPMPESEMLEWTRTTVERIAALGSEQVLEIGCGNGLLLWRLAPRCRRYLGTDFSAPVLSRLEQRLSERGKLGNVELSRRSADDFSGLESAAFDTVVLNSVVQYFPSAKYLLEVLRGAADAARPGGTIFVGDVRSLSLIDTFYTSVELARVDDAASPATLLGQVRRQRWKENELLLDPAFFLALRREIPRVRGARILPKAGRAVNEMNLFRYDVVVELDGPTSDAASRDEPHASPPLDPPTATWLDWQAAGLDGEALRRRLAESPPRALGLRRIPRPRLVREIALLALLERPPADVATVGDLRRATTSLPGLEPGELEALAREVSYTVELSWADGQAEGTYDAVLVPRGVEPFPVPPRTQTDAADGGGKGKQTEAVDRSSCRSPGRGQSARQGLPLSAGRAAADHKGKPCPIRHAKDSSTASLPPTVPVCLPLPPSERLHANDPLRGRRLRDRIEILRRHLRERLPRYLVPDVFEVLEALPRRPNGKLDRGALASSGAAPVEPPTAWEAPRGDAERVLAEIWARFLDLERVGVHDNFFTLGGDSILGIRIVAEARQAGLGLRPEDLFRHRTVAELAAAAEVLGEASAREEGPVTGPVPLTPIQHWFFERELPEPWHFNQAMLLEPREPLDPAVAEHVLAELLRHHDTLRMRYTRGPRGWRQEGTDEPSAGTPPPFTRIDLSRLGEADRRRALADAAERLQASLALTGPLLRMAHLSAGRFERLFIVIHHLVVDGVSWRVLLADFEQACRQLAAGLPVTLPPRSTSFKSWAERLAAWAHSAEARRELDVWRGLVRRRTAWPVDREGGDNSLASAADVSAALDAATTRRLLRDVPAVYRTQINDVLLTALARTLTRWCGRSEVLVELEGHGREELFADVDLSRTVGWFTTAFPVLLDLGGIADASNVGAALKAVKEQLRSIPRRGVGFGVLRYLGAAGHELRSRAGPGVTFNYLGRFDTSFSDSALLRPAPEGCGRPYGRLGRRGSLLEINGEIVDDRLRFVWTFSRGLHRRATVERLAGGLIAELEGLVAHCLSPEVGGVTPSDFPLATLEARQLDGLVGRGLEVEDVYPLTPVQQGILFHCLDTPRPGVYCEQRSWTLAGTPDLAALRRAFQRLVDRYDVLRTAFAWRGLETPLQIVYRHAELPWEEVDARARNDPELAVARLRDDDRRRGFELDRAPLTRVSLARLGDAAWRLTWTHHHLVLDGWSGPLVVAELAAIYASFACQEEPNLPRPRPYRDYVAWLAEQDFSEAESWWRRRLAGFRGPARIGSGETGDDDAGADRFVETRLRLGTASTAALRAAGRRRQVTLNTLVQGALGLLLARAGDARDVVFGVAVSGRPPELPEATTRIGLFVNTLPTRLDVRPRTRLRPWLEALQEGQVATRRYELTPLARIRSQSELPPEAPLFETVLAFESYPDWEVLRRGAGSLVLDDFVTTGETHYPLTLQVHVEEELSLLLSHDPARFDTPFAARLLRHLANLLTSLAGDEARRLGELAWLSAAERHQLLVEWNDRRPAADGGPRTHSLHALFQARAARAPDAVAVVFRDRVLSYGELDRRAGRLARRLRARGAAPERRVGLCLERGPEMVVGLLGILVSGAACVALDPTHPAARLSFVARDAGIGLLLTQDSLRGRLPDLRCPVLALDAPELPEPEAPDGAAADPGHPERLALVLYTSGSTGRPKGVAIVHRGALALVRWAREVFGPPRLDGVLAAASIQFDLSVFEIFAPLSWGGKVVLAHDTLELPELIDTRDVTMVSLVPAAAAEILRLGAVPDSVVTVNLAGEPLARSLADGFYERFRHVEEVLNLYGPSEDTTFSTAAWLVRGDRRRPPIGRPAAGSRVHVLDARLEPVPVAVPGEIHLAGEGLARGYLGRPRRTAESFLPHPFGSAGERLYRTGDIARAASDGCVEFLGRRDFQVKLRGFRIELEEISTVLKQHPAVAEAVVAVAERAPDGRQLVAWWVGRGDDADLRDFLRRRLPEHMVPAVFVRLPALPRNANDKVDRGALPAPERPRRGESSVAPRDPVEATLAELWTRVLGLEEVGVHDDFFNLGGDSILSLQIVAGAARAGLRLTSRDIFHGKTIARVAEITAATAEPRATAPPPEMVLTPSERAAADRVRRDTAEPIEDLYPLSPMQQGLLLHTLREPGEAVYGGDCRVELRGDLDTAALRRAWSRLVERHAVLRTAFLWEGLETPLQVVRRTVEPSWEQRDLSSDPRRWEASLAEPDPGLELSRPPLVRATLVRTAPRVHHLVWNVHHLVIDGWSASLLLGELFTLYAAPRDAEPSPPPFSFREYVARIRGQDLAAAEEFWRRALDGFTTPTPLLPEKIGPGGAARRRREIRRRLPEDESTRLAAFARRRQLTLNILVQGAWSLLLARYSGEHDVLFGATFAGRPDDLPGVQAGVGSFVTTLPVRAEIDRGALLPWLRRLQEKLLALRQFELTPLAEIGAWSAVPPPRPLFETLLVFENHPRQALPEIAGLEIGEPRYRVEPHYPLTLAAVPGPSLRLRLNFDARRFDTTAGERLLGHLRVLLAAMADETPSPLHGLPILSPEERHQLLTEWNDRRAETEPDLLPRVFEAQARRTPDAVAVVFEERQVSYRELERRVGRLARRLAVLGAGPEVRIGLDARRSPEMVTAFLAIQQAGAACVPFDPESPPERLDFLLRDAGVDILVHEDGKTAPSPPSAGEAGVSRLRGEHPAYVIYTSGSTGEPKGVVIPHRAIAHHMAGLGQLLRPEEEDRLLQKTPLVFDASMWEIWAPLMAGARLVLARPGVERDPGELAADVVRHAVTVVQAVPSLWRGLLEQPELRRAAGLRHAVSGGELLDPDLRARFARCCPGVGLINVYGPTEATINATCATLGPAVGPDVPIGRPLAGTAVRVVDRQLRLVPPGVPGELAIAGHGLARGYLGRPRLTAAAFVPDPWGIGGGRRLYRSGDLVCHLPGGELRYLGRVDHQVKIRGVRVEPAEIETVLRRHPAVHDAVVTRDGGRLVAHLVRDHAHRAAPSVTELRRYLERRLPEPMIPAAFVVLAELPVGPSGKVDRRALPPPSRERPALAPARTVPRGDSEHAVATVWREVLDLDQVGVDDPFFDLGGNSLLLLQVLGRLRHDGPEGRLGHGGLEPTVADLFRYPTIRSLARFLDGESTAPAAVRAAPRRAESSDVAIVGMSGRFPGAADLDAFWRNLRGGVESISFFSRQELLAAGVAPELVDDPAWVSARGVLEDVDLFDAELFGFNPREAGRLDPQHRVFLECAWEALEDAGYDPGRFDGAIGVYAGSGRSGYDAFASGDAFENHLAQGREFLPTRVSYKLDLRGPSLDVQTACSTSLVAVHLACRALCDGECDLALAGGVSILAPVAGGHLYRPGGILSPDGHCRAFDASARGTVVGQGAGAVVLKRLDEALADGDQVRAVIKGTAVNNDGAGKVGYTALSIEGQAAVIAAAQARAGVDPRTVGYVEAHGTGTVFGDSIEVTALSEVFQHGRADTCALGSVKTNIGHLDAAAGIAGLLKTVLALGHGELPPSLHFREPNPEIDFADGPFYVNTRPRPWPRQAGAPRRAGVSSFGIGGTNAHVVLEEAPQTAPGDPPRGVPLFLVSARSEAALEAAAGRLAEHLRRRAAAGADLAELADVAHTLRVGRREFPHRRAVAGRDPLAVADALTGVSSPLGDRGGTAHPPGLDVDASTAALGRQWEAGLPIDVQRLDEGERRRRVALPTYPFERRRYASSVHPRPRLSTPLVEPRTEPEREIARMWGELLGWDRVGIDDDFLELGGNSLVATRLLAELHRRWGVELSLDEFFRALTVAELARAVEAARDAPEPPSELVFENVEEGEL